jgi:hypothetical protein
MPEVEVIADVPVTQAADNVATSADDHTPNTDAIADTPDPDPTRAEQGIEELRELMTTLATTVDTLVHVVESRVLTDETPRKLPWTHRGGGAS